MHILCYIPFTRMLWNEGNLPPSSPDSQIRSPDPDTSRRQVLQSVEKTGEGGRSGGRSGASRGDR